MELSFLTPALFNFSFTMGCFGFNIWKDYMDANLHASGYGIRSPVNARQVSFTQCSLSNDDLDGILSYFASSSPSGLSCASLPNLFSRVFSVYRICGGPPSCSMLRSCVALAGPSCPSSLCGVVLRQT